MPWGALAGAAVSAVANKALSSKSNGGAGTSTASKEPWSAAAPWLEQLLGQGQSLYAQYAASPFSDAQNAAYNNQYGLSDAVRGAIPGLLGQVSAQSTGYDPRKSTETRANGWNFTDLINSLKGSQGNVAGQQITPKVQAEVKPAGWSWDGQFHDQSDMLTGANSKGTGAGGQLLGAGGFGGWQYGDAVTPGSDKFRDMNEYFLRGGSDPNNLRAGLTATGQPWVNYMAQTPGGA